jgi:hypothetical protein
MIHELFLIFFVIIVIYCIIGGRSQGELLSCPAMPRRPRRRGRLAFSPEVRQRTYNPSGGLGGEVILPLNDLSRRK